MVPSHLPTQLFLCWTQDIGIQDASHPRTWWTWRRAQRLTQALMERKWLWWLANVLRNKRWGWVWRGQEKRVGDPQCIILLSWFYGNRNKSQKGSPLSVFLLDCFFPHFCPVSQIGIISLCLFNLVTYGRDSVPKKRLWFCLSWILSTTTGGTRRLQGQVFQ